MTQSKVKVKVTGLLKYVLANISRSRFNTAAVRTKWNGARSRRVDFVAGEGSLGRHAWFVNLVGWLSSL